jgi:hypothetical protein
MQEGGTRTASAICMNEVETMVLNRDDFNGVLRKATQQAWHWPGVAWRGRRSATAAADECVSPPAQYRRSDVCVRARASRRHGFVRTSVQPTSHSATRS